MFKNEEKLQSLNRTELFNTMLQELPWSKLVAFIQANNQIYKQCTLGGHRLEKKRRHRFEKVIFKEAEKKDFTGPIITGIFAQWYPQCESLHDALENYFHSEEYKKYREEQNLEEDAYVLPEEKFEELFDVKDIQKWRILLCFSPLDFSEKQADAIIECDGEDADVAEELTNLKQTLEEERKEKNRLEVENKEVRTRLDELREEVGEIREERKQLRSEKREHENKFASLQTTNKNLQKQLKEKEDSLREEKENVESRLNQQIENLQRELRQTRSELDDWKFKYERHRNSYQELERSKESSDQELLEERQAREQMEKEVEKANKFANVALQNIDWAEIGSRLKLTPQLKRKLNNLVKKLSYDDFKAMNVNDTLKTFWNRLERQERELIEAIAESESREVQSGEIQDYWEGLNESFDDVFIGLEARAILLKLMQEIFYETFHLEELENDTVLQGAMQRRKKT